MLKIAITCLHGRVYGKSRAYFEKLLSLLVTKRNVKSSAADSAKSEYSMLVNAIVKENKDEFLLFQKDTNPGRSIPLEIHWRFMNLRSVFKTVLILSMDRVRCNEVLVPAERSWTRTCKVKI